MALDWLIGQHIKTGKELVTIASIYSIHTDVMTPAKWSRTVLECSKIILEFSRTKF